MAGKKTRKKEEKYEKRNVREIRDTRIKIIDKKIELERRQQKIRLNMRKNINAKIDRIKKK